MKLSLTPEQHRQLEALRPKLKSEGLPCDALFGIFQWGELKHSGTKEDCERVAKRWTEQNGNLDLEVIPLPTSRIRHANNKAMNMTKDLPERCLHPICSATDELPYIISTRIVEDRNYNPKFGDDRECKCGHSYYRHFDSYENMEACGCKYCGCYTFDEATDEQPNNQDQERQ